MEGGKGELMTEILPNIFAVEVSHIATNFEIRGSELRPQVRYEYFNKIRYIPLPALAYEILFDTKNVTEEQAALVVERDPVYEAYKEYEKDGPWVNEKAFNSLQSLLRSKGLDPSKNYLLIRATS